jgi:hypothetical protein
MKLQIFSDLHADVARPRPITVAPDVGAVIVAGDVCEGAENGFVRLRQIVPMQVPIIMVMGNHEYYRRHLASELAAARQAAPLYGVHLLENDVVTLGSVRFIGCSLWTDYALFGDPQRGMQAAARGLNDHRRISWSKQPWSRFRPQEAWRLHQQSRAFIETTLAEPARWCHGGGDASRPSPRFDPFSLQIRPVDRRIRVGSDQGDRGRPARFVGAWTCA